MKVKLTVFSLLLLISFNVPNSFGATIAGKTCTKSGLTRTISGMKFTCIQDGKVMKWNKGVKVVSKNKSETPIKDLIGPDYYQIKPQVLYIVGKNLKQGYENINPGIYQIKQSMASSEPDPQNPGLSVIPRCQYMLSHIYKDSNNALKIVGNAGISYTFPKFYWNGLMTFELFEGDTLIVASCFGQKVVKQFPEFYYPGSYIVGVNIQPGTYLYDIRESPYGCGYYFTKKTTDFESKIAYGKFAETLTFETTTGKVLIPSDAYEVLFRFNCGVLVKEKI